MISNGLEFKRWISRRHGEPWVLIFNYNPLSGPQGRVEKEKSSPWPLSDPRLGFLFYTLLTNAASFISGLKFNEVSCGSPGAFHGTNSGIRTPESLTKCHEISSKSPFLLTSDVSLLLPSLSGCLFSQGVLPIAFLSLLVRYRHQGELQGVRAEDRGQQNSQGSVASHGLHIQS